MTWAAAAPLSPSPPTAQPGAWICGPLAPHLLPADLLDRARAHSICCHRAWGSLQDDSHTKRNTYRGSSSTQRHCVAAAAAAASAAAAAAGHCSPPRTRHSRKPAALETGPSNQAWGVLAGWGMVLARVEGKRQPPATACRAPHAARQNQGADAADGCTMPQRALCARTACVLPRPSSTAQSVHHNRLHCAASVVRRSLGSTHALQKPCDWCTTATMCTLGKSTQECTLGPSSDAGGGVREHLKGAAHPNLPLLRAMPSPALPHSTTHAPRTTPSDDDRPRRARRYKPVPSGCHVLRPLLAPLTRPCMPLVLRARRLKTLPAGRAALVPRHHQATWRTGSGVPKASRPAVLLQRQATNARSCACTVQGLRAPWRARLRHANPGSAHACTCKFPLLPRRVGNPALQKRGTCKWVVWHASVCHRQTLLRSSTTVAQWLYLAKRPAHARVSIIASSPGRSQSGRAVCTGAGARGRWRSGQGGGAGAPATVARREGAVRC